MSATAHLRLTWFIIVAICLTLSGVQAQLPDNRIDARTGRERAVYPPARHFEHIHMRLEIDIPDMAEPYFRGRQTLTVAPIGTTREVLVLDAAMPPALRVMGVSLAGRALDFEQAERSKGPGAPGSHGTSGMLSIALPREGAVGERLDVVIDYEARFADSRGTGLHWTAGDPEGKSETDRFAQIHSQGQAQYNHRWFPCHDFPNQRLTTELIVTVEDPYIVSSNGRLISTRLGARSASGAARTVWHWRQDKPHVNYLVSLVIGRFSLVALPPSSPDMMPVNADGRRVACYLLAPVGSEDTARAAFAKTPDMITFFGELLDYPYPWDRYSQALVRDFLWSGMENTSASTLKEEYAHSAPGEEDDLIAHEIAHQWFGNLITARSWEHIWLNEGWASYAEALWDEYAAGPDAAASREAYQAKIAEFLSAQRMMNRTHAPLYPAMVSHRYGNPEEVFVKPNDVYARGAVVLHMLRQKLGDEVFFEGTRQYVRRFAFEQVETDDFRRVMEEVSGLSLEHFFDQWCYRPGLPRINAGFEWLPSESGVGEAGELIVTIEQVQRIDAANPAYIFTLPIHVRGEKAGEGSVHHIEVNARTTQAALPLRFAPDHIDIDPDMTVAALTRVTEPLAAAAD